MTLSVGLGYTIMCLLLLYLSYRNIIFKWDLKANLEANLPRFVIRFDDELLIVIEFK